MLLPLVARGGPGVEEEQGSSGVNLTLLGVVLAVSALSWLFDLYTESDLVENPLLALALPREGWTASQLITSSLLHVNGWHLLGNLIALAVFGAPVNRKLGNGLYALLCLASALAASAAWLWLGAGARVVGASGIGYGVMGAFLLLCSRREVQALFPAPWALFAAAVPLTFSLAPRLVVPAALATLGGYALYTLVELILRPDARGSLGAVLSRLVGLRWVRVPGWVAVGALLLAELGEVVALTAAGERRAVVALLVSPSVAHEAHLGALLAGLTLGALAVLLGWVEADGAVSTPRPLAPRVLAPRPTVRRTRRRPALTYSDWVRGALPEAGYGKSTLTAWPQRRERWTARPLSARVTV